MSAPQEGKNSYKKSSPKRFSDQIRSVFKVSEINRWAKKRMLNRVKGHEKGADTVRMAVRASRELGIAALTLYAFSTENWNRTRTEIDGVMALLTRPMRAPWTL